MPLAISPMPAATATGYVDEDNFVKSYGFSVRCVQD